ncbi:alanine acetyltransferase [Oceanicola sp. 22II-s10i]|uniref:GNAT family N-acetyltransferase n=1 Tax=Oceanicola sp. 22II-s10i TaxID=1317116 RepID=UPI000B52329B|nr:GNAT family N-acetyltransferase [Oceanicola sp. 22II-s10i]OWU83320.1 alanine acetyltransferase [Oceanicola sp. 22II-s10i]
MTPDEMASLHARCFTMPRSWSAAEFDALLARTDVFALGDAGGFLLGRVVADEAELLTLAVAPEYRRQGRAAALLADFAETARQNGAATAFLEVAAGNDAAIALYRGAGWTEAGRRRAYYRGPDGAVADALVLTRPLA